MPANYTNHEFMKMREQAIVNAREMQNRAAIKDNSPVQSQSMQEHSNALRFEVRPDTENKPKQIPHHAPDRQNVTHNPSHSDDRMLIMTLLLILIADGADKMLIFALMYIMM